MDRKQGINEDRPLSILGTTGRFGVKGMKYFGMVALLFGVVNITFLVVGLFRFWNIDKSTISFAGILLILALGILFTVAALYFTYKYLIMDGLKLIYSYAAPFFGKLCNIIADKFGGFFSNKMNIKDVHIDRAFSVGSVINDVYGHKVPRTFKKGIAFLMKRIPFADIIVNVKNGIKDRNEEQVSAVLYQEVDFYITNSLLGGNSMKWLLWLLPLNILIQLAILYFLIG